MAQEGCAGRLAVLTHETWQPMWSLVYFALCIMVVSWVDVSGTEEKVDVLEGS